MEEENVNWHGKSHFFGVSATSTIIISTFRCFASLPALALERRRVKVEVQQPVIDSKGVNNRRNRRNRRNRNTRRNLLPNCYQNMASGFGAESWGIGPFTTLER